jgi:arylsulfatase A-like enzyme
MTKPPYNLVFIILDQRVDRLLEATGYSLPAMDALARRGVTFQKHYISSAMCTASRASFLTGQTPHVTGVLDQMQYSYTRSLSPKMPNMGSVMRELGYKTAYFGKFEMDKNILSAESTVNYTDAIKDYGFDVFSAGGDIGSAPYSGFDNDPFIAGESVRGLHTLAAEARRTGQPFFMITSLVNPHDVMYANANVPDREPIQKPVVPFAATPPPEDTLYKKQWDFSLPESLGESLTGAGMPAALLEYKKGWDAWSGAIPAERKDMWKIFYNYYLNAIADADRSLAKLVDAMDEMDLWRDTAVIFTADHGEMAGAHGGLKGKGPFSYEENIHVPLIVAHPAAKQGTKCAALTSHLDLLPTLVGLTGLPDAKRPPAVTALPGHDFSSLLADPERAETTAVRPAILFNYVGAGTVDAKYLDKTMASLFANKATPPLSEADLSKRGFLAVVFDGRYKFGRFYAPFACNTPKTLNELFENNDVQLFDLQNDPQEVRNLAIDLDKNEATILRMNALLNELIAKEVGEGGQRLLEAALESFTR